MFGIKHNECVGFESRWKVKNTEVQTVTDQPLLKSTDADMQKLAEWLSKMYPKVTREIDNANNSQAFKGYKLHGDSTEANCKLIQSINVSNTAGSGDKVLDIIIKLETEVSRISAICWNQTGKSVAVTCNYEHNSWCYHLGHISIYTLNRNNSGLCFIHPHNNVFTTEKKKIPDAPRKKLSTETCVTSLKFHPIHPAIIAAGTISGGIVVWNMQNDEGDNIIGTANAHEEAVTQLSWVNDVYSAKTILLATSSTDGLLKLWNFNLANASLSIKAKYKIKSPVLGSICRKTETPEYIEQKSSRGIICFDFSKQIADLFVVGVEGGLVVQCSVLGTSELKVVLKEEPAQFIFVKNPLNDLTFVPHEDKLVVGCGINGIFEIFHLISGKRVGNITTEKVKKQVLTCLAINNV
ncbi:hypothetical protein NQ314_009676, partial [Rhamnusium bicolor]